MIASKQRPTWRLLVERWHPAAFALLAAVAAWRFGYFHILSDQGWVAPFVGHVVTGISIFLGYLIAVVAILPSVEDRRIVKKFQEWGYFVFLVRYLSDAIWACFFALGLSLAFFVLPVSVKNIALVDGLFSAAWWGSLAYAVAAVVRATNLMLKLLTAK